MNFDFSDYTYSGLIGIFSAIIGMCYPLMLQAIERIDEKYHVIRFVELFRKKLYMADLISFFYCLLRLP